MQAEYVGHEVDSSVLAKWQRLLDMAAKIFSVPAALIMRVWPYEIEVLLASEGGGNPYEVSERAPLGSGLYCETVMRTRSMLEVQDAHSDPLWDHNPDIELGMICYLGIPLVLPNDEVFGTLCVLDTEPRRFADAYKDFLLEMKSSIEQDFHEKFAFSQALQSSREQFSAFFDLIPDYCFVLSSEGTILDANEASVKLFGCSHGEIIGTNIVEKFSHGSSEPGREAPDWRSLMGAEGVVVGVNGPRSVLPSVSPIEGHLELPGQLVVLRDITDYKQKEKELFQAQKMEAVGALTGGVAHDFNNMMSVILGYAGMMQHMSTGQGFFEAELTHIVKAARHASRIAKQLLLFARGTDYVVAPHSVNTIIESLSEMMGQLLGEQIELRLELSDSLWPVSLDDTMFRQVIVNLLVNARDAMPMGGRVSCVTHNSTFHGAGDVPLENMVPGEYVQLDIVDTGEGMDEEQICSIFEPFYSTKESGKGTGLGLSVVKKIISDLHGEIMVTSSKGVGSRFTIYLPRCVTVVDERHADQSLSACEKRWAGRALIVEDEQVVGELAAVILQKMGFTTTLKMCPMEALEWSRAQGQGIDLLITDVVMPKLDGCRLSEQLLQQYPEMKVIFTSGYPGEFLAQYKIDPSMDNFLQKPFSQLDVCEKVEMAFTR